MDSDWREDYSSYQGVSSVHLDNVTHYRKYVQAVLRQNIAFFDRIGVGEITSRLSHDADLIRDGISEKVNVVHQRY